MGSHEEDFAARPLARSVLFLMIGVMGTVLVIAILLASSAGATGGCGGG